MGLSFKLRYYRHFAEFLHHVDIIFLITLYAEWGAFGGGGCSSPHIHSREMILGSLEDSFNTLKYRFHTIVLALNIFLSLQPSI